MYTALLRPTHVILRYCYLYSNLKASISVAVTRCDNLGSPRETPPAAWLETMADTDPIYRVRYTLSSLVSPSVCFCMWLWWLLLFDLSGHVVFLGTGTRPTLFYPMSIPSIRSHLSATAIWFHRRWYCTCWRAAIGRQWTVHFQNIKMSKTTTTIR